MAKRKLSKKQLSNLAKGRRALLEQRRQMRGTKTVHHKRAKSRQKASSPVTRYQPIFIEGGQHMATRKKYSHRRKAHVKHVVYGRRHRSSSMGAFSLPSAGNIQSMLTQAAIMLLGALAGSAVATMIPVDKEYKALIPIAGGLGLGIAGRRNAMMKSAGMGMIVGGGMAITKQFAPQIPLLAGDSISAPVYRPVTPQSPKMLGAPAKLGIPAVMAGYKSPASM